MTRSLLSAVAAAVCAWHAAPVHAQKAAPAAAAGPVLASAALAQVGVTTIYDPAYVRLDYPGGDVPQERGVCCDVVIRAFRQTGRDLQRLVHEDMKAGFSTYPKNWGLTKPDSNIDHRRVPNLMKFFERKGKSAGISENDADYRPGDVVAWRFPNNLYHIGIVAAEKAPGTERRYLIHNVGAGAQKEDVLRAWKIIGHYRWE